MKEYISKHILSCITVLALVLIVLVFNPFDFSYFSVCRICGKKRFSYEKLMPFVDICYWASHEEADTELSKVLYSNGLVDTHEHNWIFGHGRGFCMSGCGPYSSPDRYVGMNNAQAIKTMLDIGHKREAKQAVLLMLDPNNFSFLSAPKEGFRSEKEFQAWWKFNLECTQGATSNY